MSAEVIVLPGCGSPIALVDGDAQTVVQHLQSALAEARSGKFYAVGVVLVCENGSEDCDTHRVWCSSPKAPPTRLVSGLQMLVADIAVHRS